MCVWSEWAVVHWKGVKLCTIFFFFKFALSVVTVASLKNFQVNEYV